MPQKSEDLDMTVTSITDQNPEMKGALCETQTNEIESDGECRNEESVTENFMFAQNVIFDRAEKLLQKFVRQNPSREATRIRYFSSIEALLNQLSSEARSFLLMKFDLHHYRGRLHYAALYNDIRLTHLLLNKGDNPNIIDENGQAPLHFAAQYSYDKQENCSEKYCSGEYNTVIYHLVSSGANTKAQDNSGRTPLHYAAIIGNAFAVRELLKLSKINTEIFDNKMLTPLHCAAMHDRTEIVALLLDANANPEVFDKKRSTPLIMASINGNAEIVLLLLESFEKKKDSEKLKKYIDEENILGQFALHLAINKGYFEVADILLRKGANHSSVSNGKFTTSDQPLHIAAASRNAEIVKSLLKYGAEVNCIDKFHNTPLHKAAEFNAAEVVEVLLEKGANIEARNYVYFTPLMNAAANGHVDVVRKLTRSGASVDAENTRGRNSLHLAAEKNHSAVLTILLNYGADIEIADWNNRTSLHWAAGNGHIDSAQVLISYSESIVNLKDSYGYTPMHGAVVGNGTYELLNVLLNAGADLNAKDTYSRTPLHYAAERGSKQCSQMLLDAHCSVDPLDKSKETPLHLAVQKGHKHIVKLLLNCGADTVVCNGIGENCMDMAIKKKHKNVALEILSNTLWKRALRKNWRRYDKSDSRNTPLRDMIRYTPDIAEHVLDKCIKRDDFTNELTYDYQFIDDTFGCHWPYRDNESDVYTKSGSVKTGVTPYTADREFLKRNHPLMLMVKYGREDLLSHPLCKMLLNHKWRKHGCYVYYGNLCIYVLFLTLLTLYVFSSTPPCPVSKADSKCCSERNFTCQPHIGKCNHHLNQNLLKKYQISIYFFVSLLLIKEVYQIYQNGRKYLDIENVLEWGCYISTLVFVADLTECSSQTGIRKVWQWELGSLSLFSAWVVLLMFVSKFPFPGIYVVMFQHILYTFLKLSVVFFLFVAAFAMSFFSVLQNQGSFESLPESIMKTSVMMTGEIEFDEIFNNPNNKVYFQGPAYFLLILFLLFMAVILMNMLIGLAVDDIKQLKRKATLNRLAMQVELFLSVERVLPTFFLRRCVTRFTTEVDTSADGLRNDRNCKRWPELLDIPLKVLSEEAEGEKDKLSQQLKDIQESFHRLEEEIKSIQSIVQLKKD